MVTVVYTVGHGRSSIEDILDVFKAKGIDVVVDVRSIPRSRWNPRFNKEALQKTLNNNRIEYLYLGEDLGGFQEGGFACYMRSRKYTNAVSKLLKLIKGKTAVILCSERDYRKCHRRLIAESLTKKGVVVEHL